ncbi:hypothetical protein [Polluticoccus soli]|uniref:hypothetical protein n=1 Tax=Polluticoccus soli TaxID=3034150 RepID=UPI0023E1A140|nr:hypothetical protein [Flavipsychrobacter sp. JY13-12]
MRRLSLLFCLVAGTTWCSAQTASDNPLFNTFKQGLVQGEGNAASVAVIKAAIGTFGVNNVFRYFSTDNAAGKYTIRLRNDETITLTFTELKQAATASAFSEKSTDLLSHDIRKYAELCFAVMAKKLQQQNPRYNYVSAVSDINDGIEPADAAALLGLKLKSLKPCTVDNLSHYNHIIVCNPYHIAYANTGYYDELKNQAGVATLNDFRQNHYGAKCALRRCNISEAFRVDEF